LTEIRKRIQINFIKSHPAAEWLFRADAQTDERTDSHNDATACCPIIFSC